VEVRLPEGAQTSSPPPRKAVYLCSLELEGSYCNPTVSNSRAQV
jgi:hypothetical protein